MPDPIVLQSPRLRLRATAEADLPALLNVYLSNPAFVSHHEGARGESGYFDLAMLQRDWWIAQMMPGRHMLGIYLADGGAAVGMADYLEENPDDGMPWLGFLMIARDHQRQGLGTEAYTCLAAHFRDHYGWPALRIGVESWNTGAFTFWERLGFGRVPDEVEPAHGDSVVLQRTL